MRKEVFVNTILICILLLGAPGCSTHQNVLTIDDIHGVLGATKAPVSVEIQLESSGEGENLHLVMMMPDGEPGLRRFKLVKSESPFNAVMKATLDPNSGQVIIEEKGEKVLQYNYQTVYEKDVIRPRSEKNVKLVFTRSTGIYFEEYLKVHPGISKDTLVTSSIYSVPRSDYIHPFYGLEGEMLTSDWPDGGHPHHRGIFWAWPEVEYGTERGDIYALQRVFARPTGNIEYTSGPVYAQIIAENLWMWEETEPIVREHAVICVYRATSTPLYTLRPLKNESNKFI